MLNKKAAERLPSFNATVDCGLRHFPACGGLQVFPAGPREKLARCVVIPAVEPARERHQDDLVAIGGRRMTDDHVHPGLHALDQESGRQTVFRA